MKVAIPQWQGRVSPVFDVAGEVLVADSDGGRIRLELGEAAGFERVRRLVEGNVGVLLCCSISRFLEAAVREAGIDLIPHVCGEVEEILAAWTSGRLRPELFLMPGCRSRGRCRGAGPGERRRRSCLEPEQEVTNMPAGDGTGPRGEGPMTGRGGGRCGGRGRRPSAGAPGGGSGSGKTGAGPGRGRGRRSPGPGSRGEQR